MEGESWVQLQTDSLFVNSLFINRQAVNYHVAMSTNAERTASTRARLIGQARTLFARDGFALTGTESILVAAGVRRGAMYHHFKDKAALFEAVCLLLSEEAVPAIEAATARARDPLDALIRGSIAWIEYITRTDVRRILVIDAPTVLGWERWEALDRRLSYESLSHAIREAIDGGAIAFDADADILTTMINGALNAIAMRVGAPGTKVPKRTWHAAIRALFEGLAVRATPVKSRRRTAG
jgi:AcrR family transcriptional regulator